MSGEDALEALSEIDISEPSILTMVRVTDRVLLSQSAPRSAWESGFCRCFMLFSFIDGQLWLNRYDRRGSQAESRRIEASISSRTPSTSKVKSEVGGQNKVSQRMSVLSLSVRGRKVRYSPAIRTAGALSDCAQGERTRGVEKKG